jgi:hypothetical protein
MSRRKHRKDHNHGKGGFVGGNIRYNRNRKKEQIGLGRARASSCSKNS